MKEKDEVRQQSGRECRQRERDEEIKRGRDRKDKDKSWIKQKKQ